jgi:hypothetical protein
MWNQKPFLLYAALAMSVVAACGGNNVVGGTLPASDAASDLTQDVQAPEDTPVDVVAPPLDANTDADATPDAGESDITQDTAPEGGTARCRDNTDCGANEFGFRVCDTVTGTCVACTSANRGSCTPGQYCTPANRCEAGCARDGDCAADGGALHCNTTTHTCDACANDSHCPAGSVCGAMGECVPGCNERQACPSGESCCAGTCRRTASDVMNCGACGTVCPARANATPTCAAGACTAPCVTGFADCDGDASNGCEAALSGTTHCGVCGVACAGTTPVCGPSGAGFACSSGCDPGQTRCAGGPCVDAQTSTEHCGGCGRACPVGPDATATCVAGRCGITCAAGFADCDMNPMNGCEVDTRSSSAHCGGCGMACVGAANQTAACALGACVRTCDATFADCDTNAANGCEAPLTGASHCGRCGNACAGSTPVCTTTGGTSACGTGCPGAQTRCPNGTCADLSTDRSNCGACGMVCAGGANQTATCVAGRCAVACDEGFADCDTDPSNGCETDTRASTGHCGRCGNACPAGANGAARCAVGACQLACNAGFGNCDGSAANGCEAELTRDTAHCGACGRACGTGEICSAGDCTRVRINAIHNPVALTSEAIFLEGNYASTTTVNFPGGPSLRATAAGASRVQSVVPAEATAGSLTVSSGGTTSRALPFRRITFAPGVHASRLGYDQTAYPRQATRLVTPRDGAASALVGNFFYVMGGDNGGARNTIERALVNADGTLGAFNAVAGQSLAAARWLPSSVALPESVYLLGGFNERALNTVERAVVNADGTLGSFGLVTGVTLGTARFHHASAVVGNAVYVFGGATAMGVATDTVERALIRGDGTLGPFTPAGRLAAARYGASALVLGNDVYLVGGAARAGSYLNTVERAPINSDGTLGAFAVVAGVTVANGRAGHTSVVVGGSVLLVGGENASGAVGTIERAAVGAGGTLGSFAVVPGATLATPRTNHVSQVVGNYVFSVGGDGAGLLATVERASFNGSGAIGPFSTALDVSLTGGRSGAGTVVVGDRLYVLGGERSGAYLRTIERATVSPDGALGAFAQLPETLTTARAGTLVAVIGNYVYAVGGYDGGRYVTSVERAPINPDGSLGSFAAVSSTLAVANAYMTGAIVGDFLYLFGGDGPITSTNHIDTVQRARIAADGSLGPFMTAGALTQIRSYTTASVFGNFVSILGGHNNSHQPIALVERATANADGTLSAFATSGAGLTQLAVAMDSSRATLVGNFLYVTAGSTAAVQRAALNADHTLGTFSAVGAGTTVARSYPSSVVLGNYFYLIGGNSLASVERATLQ